MNDEPSASPPSHSRFAEIFFAFLKLGMTSFGGPIAHIGYFNREFVEKRSWVDAPGFVDLLTLCQFLPGPTSSQLGFALGVKRGQSLLGGLAAWLGFTLPSALTMLAFALGVAALPGAVAPALCHGLKLVAVVIVAQALIQMTQPLTIERERIAIAAAAIMFVFGLGPALGQIGAILMGLAAGAVFCRASNLAATSAPAFPISPRAGGLALVLFLALFLIPPFFTGIVGSRIVALFEAFYRSGALVFGGGHVVLPLLQQEVVAQGWTSSQNFLAGYGAAQTIPGPLFTIATYLGAMANPAFFGVPGATIALIAIFLPGMLLIYGLLPFWDILRTHDKVQASMRGASSAATGVLAAAFYNPVCSSSLVTWLDLVVAAAGFVLLMRFRWPSWAVVLVVASAGSAGAVLMP